MSKTLEIINHIELASKEQLSGIEQINHSVTILDSQTQKNANVAGQTNDIALSTQNIANMVVTKANEKNFIGKDSVKADDIGHFETSSKSVYIEPTPKKIEKKVVHNTSSKVVQSKSSDDEWESF